MRWAVFGALAWAGEDLDAAVRELGEQDSKASTKVGCWCESVDNLLAARADDAGSDLSHLGTAIAGTTANNAALGIETQRHERAAAQHAQSLDAASSMRDRAHEKFVTEEQDAQQALESLDSARGALSPMSFLQQPSAVAGALEGLEDTFTRSLEKAREDETSQKGQFDDLYAAKAKLQNLEAQSANRKKSRMADQAVQIARDKETSAGLEARQGADLELRSAVSSVCKQVEDGATARTAQRQEVLVALSSAKADQAQAALHQSFSLAQTRRFQDEAVDALRRLQGEVSNAVPAESVSEALELAQTGDVAGAAARVESMRSDATGALAALRADTTSCKDKAEGEQEQTAASAHTASEDAAAELRDTTKRAQELQDLVAQSAGLEQSLGQVLHSEALQALNAQGRLDGAAWAPSKAALARLQELAQQDLDALPGAFAAVVAAARGSAKADMLVNAARLQEKAAASSALVSVEKEERSLQEGRCADLDARSTALAKDERSLRTVVATLDLGLR